MLISSYFLIDKPFNFRRILKLWVQAVFYGVIIFLIAHIASPNEYPLKSLLPFFVPVLRSPWWFFTCYTGLVCLAPFLSKTANSLSESQYRTFFVILLLFGCTLTVGIPYGDIMGGNKGFSLIWFIVLFFIGGFFESSPTQSPFLNPDVCSWYLFFWLGPSLWQKQFIGIIASVKPLFWKSLLTTVLEHSFLSRFFYGFETRLLRPVILSPPVLLYLLLFHSVFTLFTIIQLSGTIYGTPLLIGPY